MRKILLLAAAILLASAPAFAAGYGEKSDKEEPFTPVFGNAFCKPYFPCPSPSNRSAMNDIEAKAISSATNCVGKKFLVEAKNGKFFEESYGLDSNLCLKSKPMPKGKSGLSITPECCVKPVSGKPNMCQVVCKLLGKQ